MSISHTHGWHKMKVNLFFFTLAPWPSTFQYLAPCRCLSFPLIYHFYRFTQPVLALVGRSCNVSKQIYHQPPCYTFSRNSWTPNVKAWAKQITHTPLLLLCPTFLCRWRFMLLLSHNVCCIIPSLYFVFRFLFVSVAPPHCLLLKNPHRIDLFTIFKIAARSKDWSPQYTPQPLTPTANYLFYVTLCLQPERGRLK